MKKYLIPKEDGIGWKLIAHRGVPSHAICEAPDNWTDEMEPYIYLTEVVDGGNKTIKPELDKKYFDWLANKASAKLQVDLKRMETIQAGIKKAQKEKAFNELKPYQRFVKSILGDYTEKAENALMLFAIKKIFGEPTVLKKEGPL